MKKILFISTIFRVGEKVYPIIPELARIFQVDILHMYQMSKYTLWGGDRDMRKPFYHMCQNVCGRVFNGPAFNPDPHKHAISNKVFIDDFDTLLGRNYYDLVIVDNNITIKGGENSEIYEWFYKQDIPILACPHGSRDPKGYRVCKRIGKHYNYSFIFGSKEHLQLISLKKDYKKYQNKLLCGGIPSNDNLKNCKRGNKYILIVPNFTNPKFLRRQLAKFKPFTEAIFSELNILKLSDMYDKCDIIIKEKSKITPEHGILRSSLKRHKRVHFLLDVEDDNQLIADAICVISAPSTMAFKPIQMGIPTVIMKSQGMLGNFFDFPGLIDQCNWESMKRVLDLQVENGKCCDFIRNTLKGGLEFNSTQVYIDHIIKLVR